jgi:hypothetical protein
MNGTQWLGVIAIVALLAVMGWTFWGGSRIKRHNNPDNWPPGTG